MQISTNTIWQHHKTIKVPKPFRSELLNIACFVSADEPVAWSNGHQWHQLLMRNSTWITTSEEMPTSLFLVLLLTGWNQLSPIMVGPGSFPYRCMIEWMKIFIVKYWGDILFRTLSLQDVCQTEPRSGSVLFQYFSGLINTSEEH